MAAKTRSTAKSAARSERMKARWTDPAHAEWAAAQRAKLAAGNAARAAAKAAKGAGSPPPAPETGGGVSASDPFSAPRIFGRRRSGSS